MTRCSRCRRQLPASGTAWTIQPTLWPGSVFPDLWPPTKATGIDVSL